MRVLHVIPGISRSSGGPSRSVQGLVAGLNAAGEETWLMTIYKGQRPWMGGVPHFINGGLIEDAIARVSPDVVHLHGIWSWALHRCAVVCRRWNIPYVIAPRGMLEPWSLRQKWFKKRVARWLYQDRDLKSAAALHATAYSEAEQFKKLCFNNLIIVSPNGVNVPKYLEPQHTLNTQKRVLFVSRMHPKKGVMELVEAWNSIKLTTHNSQLINWICELVYTIGGDFERKYETKVREKVGKLGLEDSFIFTGALTDEEKWKAYARADLFILPTYSENFGIVVAEALWAGVPVITTKGTPWHELNQRSCGWWIDVGVEHLMKTIELAISLTDGERREMGERGRRLIEEKYTWNAVVQALIKGYREIVADNKCITGK